MEEKKEEIFGNLFGTINLLNEDHLELLLNNIDKDHAIYYLVEAVKSAHTRGAFTIGESEIISKSIRVVSKQ
jgi:hypothetical protein